MAGKGDAKVQAHTNGRAPKVAANGTTTTELPPPKEAPVFYDLSRNKYLFLRTAGDWITLPEESVGRILRSNGFHRSRFHGNSLNFLEQELMRLQLENGVAYAGELAGYPAGEHWICGQRCLITRGPVIPEPKPGKFPTLNRFFKELFGKYQPEFYGWLKCARQSLRSGAPWRPGQILVLAGPAGCGKNLCQALITEMLGGRAAKPYRYMVGETSFNRELLTAEHLVIQDEQPMSDFKARRNFGARIKDFTVNELQSFHAKGKDAISLMPFWRLSISLNEEPENLQILPPLDETLRDKLMLFRCSMTNLPFDGSDPRQRAKFREKLSAELPGFLHWLARWRIPDRMKNQRFGVEAHLDPTLVSEIESLSPELRMWALIQGSGILPASSAGWVGSAAELESQLRDKFPREVDRLFSFASACGTYLSRLAKKPDLQDRITPERGPDNTRQWMICGNHVAKGEF